MSRLFLKDRVPRVYDATQFIEIIRQLETQINDLTEGREAAYHAAATAAPTTGTWVRGDWVKNSEPSSSGYFGWVCTASGTPGTWLGFGTIA